MLPIQEIEISTKKGRRFSVHLEKWSPSHFACKLAAFDLGPQLPADSAFGPFSDGPSASEAYEALISGLRTALTEFDPGDAISEVDNPCNTEFIDVIDQRRFLGNAVLVKVNGEKA